MLNKNIKYLLLTPVFILLFSACGPANTSAENIIETEILLSDDFGILYTYTTEGIEINETDTSKSIKLLTTQSSYNEEIIKYEPKFKVDDLNFSNGNVLLIDMGEKGYTGYFISTKVIEKESSLLVNIEYCSSPMLSTAISRSYQFVWIPSKKELKISETHIEKSSCK